MILAIDYAAMDGNNDSDFTKAFAAGARIVGLRKFQHYRGRDIPDHCYAHADKARAAGMTVLPYFFPGCSTHDATPKAQVAALKASAGEIIPGIDFPVALDIEGGSQGWQATGHSIPEVLAILEQFVRELEDQFGCKPAVYTSFNQWWSLGLPKAPWLADCLLWVKTAYRLAAGHALDQVVPPIPHVGAAVTDPKNYYRIPDPWAASGWFLQQFQGDATGFPGMQGRVDVNRFNVLAPDARDALVGLIRRRLDKHVAEQPPTPADPLILDEELTERVKLLQPGIATGVIDQRTLARIAWL